MACDRADGGGGKPVATCCTKDRKRKFPRRGDGRASKLASVFGHRIAKLAEFEVDFGKADCLRFAVVEWEG